jgi:gliding motility-associated-like protein
VFLNVVINQSEETVSYRETCDPDDDEVFTQLFTNQAGCDSIHKIIPVYPSSSELPVASFYPNPVEVMLPDGIVTLNDNSQNANFFEWDFGDGSGYQTTESPLTHQYDQPGVYNIQLTVFNELGCADSINAVIIVKEDFNLYVPNAFTPDNDDYNNVFLPIVNGDFDIYSYRLLIFNRWGEVLFESNDAEIGWDGAYGGEIVATGTYIWQITLNKQSRDEPSIYRGHVTLLK